MTNEDKRLTGAETKANMDQAAGCSPFALPVAPEGEGEHAANWSNIMSERTLGNCCLLAGTLFLILGLLITLGGFLSSLVASSLAEMYSRLAAIIIGVGWTIAGLLILGFAALKLRSK